MTTVAAQKDKDLQNRNSQFQLEGRVVSLAEQTMQLLGCGSVITSFQFEFIPTQQMALRPVTRKSPAIRNCRKQGLVPDEARGPADLNTSQMFPGFKVRQDCAFPDGRQFDNFQVISYLDGVWTFFARTPASGCAATSKSHTDQLNLLAILLDPEHSNCLWIDGLGCQVRIRQSAVSAVLGFIRNVPAQHANRDFGSKEQRNATEALFQELLQWCVDPVATR
jgi:hypothetical protein